MEELRGNVRKLLAGSISIPAIRHSPPTAFGVFQERKARIDSGIDSGSQRAHPALNPVNSTIGSFYQEFAPQQRAIAVPFGPRFACTVP